MELQELKSRLKILNGELEATKWERKQVAAILENEILKETATKIAALKNEDQSMFEFSIMIHLNEMMTNIKNLNE